MAILMGTLTERKTVADADVRGDSDIRGALMGTLMCFFFLRYL